MRAQGALLGDTFTPRQYNDRVPGEEEERNEPRRPRVVDKRVSARRDTEASRSEAEPAPDPGPAPEIAPSPSPSAVGPEAETAGPDAAPEPSEAAGGSPHDAVWTPEREAEARAIAEELSRVPALDWVANSAVTLANVAAAKIQSGDAPDAQLAIDALGALIDGLGSRLGEAEQPLKQTLAQLRLAYTQALVPPGRPGSAP